MRWYDHTYARVGLVLVHAPLNAYLVALSGMKFSGTWSRMGRHAPAESVLLNVIVSVVVFVATFAFWAFRMRNQLSRAVVLSAMSIAAGAVESFLVTSPPDNPPLQPDGRVGRCAPSAPAAERLYR